MIDLSAAFRDPIYQPFTLHGTNDCCAILVHGFPGTPADVRPIAEFLHQAGWTVQAPLLPGFGSGINSLGEKSFEDWLQAVLDLIKQSRTNYQKVILLGYSMGGAISISASAKTQLDGLILLAPFWQVNHFLWRIIPLAKILIPKFKPFRLMRIDFNDPIARKEIATFLPDANLDDPIIQKQIIEFAVPTNILNQVRIAGNLAYQNAPFVKVPTLVIQGEQDELVLAHLTRQMIQQFPHEVDYVSVDSDHMITQSQKPHWDKLLNAILNFIQQFEGVKSHD